jgi:hypothetical protein
MKIAIVVLNWIVEACFTKFFIPTGMNGGVGCVGILLEPSTHWQNQEAWLPSEPIMSPKLWNPKPGWSKTAETKPIVDKAEWKPWV